MTGRAWYAHIVGMLLDRYLADNGIATSDFAKLIGKDRTFVARLRSGRNGPSPKVMQKIIEVTGGQVTAADIHLARLAFQRSRGAASASAVAS